MKDESINTLQDIQSVLEDAIKTHERMKAIEANSIQMSEVIAALVRTHGSQVPADVWDAVCRDNNQFIPFRVSVLGAEEGVKIELVKNDPNTPGFDSVEKTRV